MSSTTRGLPIRQPRKNAVCRIVCYPSRGGIVKSEDFASYQDISKDDCVAFVRALCDLGGGVMTVVQGDELVSSIDI